MVISGNEMDLGFEVGLGFRVQSVEMKFETKFIVTLNLGWVMIMQY
jgi:hypothetical protein